MENAAALPTRSAETVVASFMIVWIICNKLIARDDD
jgi:hypothetical protein